MSSGHIRAGKLTTQRINKSVISDRESEMQLGDGLDQPYQAVLRNMKQSADRLKAKKTYCAPEDDIIAVGSAMNSRNRKKI